MRRMIPAVDRLIAGSSVMRSGKLTLRASAGKIESSCTSQVPVSSRGQDTWFSATGPGFESPYRYQPSPIARGFGWPWPIGRFAPRLRLAGHPSLPVHAKPLHPYRAHVTDTRRLSTVAPGCFRRATADPGLSAPRTCSRAGDGPTACGPSRPACRTPSRT